MSNTVKTHRSQPDEAAYVTLTDAAIVYLKQYCAESEKAQVRLLMKASGCSGYAYQLEPASMTADEDTVIHIDDDLAMVIDSQSLPLVKGTHIDLVKEGINKRIVYDNPRAQGVCGCGESFTFD